MQLTKKQVRTIFKKLGMEVKETHHATAKLLYKGKVIIWTKVSQGAGDIKGNVPNLIRKQFKLTKEQFQRLRDCPLKLPGLLEIYKLTGVITE